MARSNLLNTRTTTLLELLGNGRTYRVPPFQRDYSWDEEQWEDLWHDIVELRTRPDEQHYMGTIVVEGRDDRQLSIIDGQQRLATLSLFALAVISKLQDFANRGVDPEHNRERARALRYRFIGDRDPASLIESSKLSLNHTDDAFYQDYLVQLRPPLNSRSLRGSNRLLWNCFQYFINRIGELPDLAEDGHGLAELLAETAARQLMFILITVDDELNAYTVFETLNARGLELSSTDLLKNYLFSRVRVTADLEALQRRWRALIATVGQERFPELLRFHLLCEHPRIRSQRLFKIVRDDVRTAKEVFALVEVLERRAMVYAALMDSNHEYWSELGECRPFIKELVLFRVRQMTPLLFAAWECLSRSEFASVLRIVTVISFRYSVVGGLNPGPLEPIYHQAARAVLRGETRTPAQIFEQLRSIYVQDEKFSQDFARLTIDTVGARKRLVRYVLARLEADLSGRACDPDSDPGTIEHILPENPMDAWEMTFPRNQWNDAIYRLGNLTLLEPSLNRDVGNELFGVKRAAYVRSTYLITQRVADITANDEEWTPDRLEARQRDMATRARHVWRLGFD